jgi:flavin-dependent dehydrogenase
MAATYDLIVIGGGPAGAAAAITAARRGVRVLLLERGRFPRHKVCGEFVSAESLGLLSSLLTQRHLPLLREALLIPQARLFVDGQTVHSAITPPAASIARFDLDSALWDSAVELGVEAKQQITVQAVQGSGPFHITTSSGELHARAVVNASGRWSNLSADVSGRQRTSEKWLGVKAHFAEARPNLSVDLYFFDGGYCGVQPLSDHSINACSMVRADVGSTLSEVFRRHSALRDRSRTWQPLTEPVFTSPLIFRKPQPVRDGILMAGDAAAFVDPFVGDGISLALRTGALAGECLGEFFRGQSLQAALEQYTESYQRRFGTVFRTSSNIRKLLRLPKPVRKPMLFMLQNAPGLTEYLVSKTR